MNYNNTHYLGIRKKVFKTLHYIVLIAMLHSTFVAPAQGILEDYFKHKEFIYYPTPVSRKHPEKLFGTTNTPLPAAAQNSITNSMATMKPSVSNVTTKENNNSGKTFWNTDIKEGVIGITKDLQLDSPSDNLFKVTIDGLPDDSYDVFLTYDLYGVTGVNAVSRAINDRMATGGYLVKEYKGWTRQKEEIDRDWLHKGENKILFSVPEGSFYQYRIKNLAIQIEKKVVTTIAPTVIINSPEVTLSGNNKIYIKGFLKGKENSLAKVEANGASLTYNNGAFEGFITLTDQIKKEGLVVVKATDSNGLIGQELLSVANIIEADQSFIIEKVKDYVADKFVANKKGQLVIPGVKLFIPDSAMALDKIISIRELRKIDIAPLGAGLINVTKGGKAYRFLPDGTKFEKPVKIVLEYDSLLIPKGYTVADIKTFYFDTEQKRWIEVKRDKVDVVTNSITSETIHFTDYINGIVQVPESPQTSAFAPTMMNDIKAADPSAGITLINPPQVSQKGSANVVYPIKIPAGRKGMQPDVVLQYENEAQEGWIGLGWDLNVPFISIDTRWGVPNINGTHETEIYTLAGEQLMYPPLLNSANKRVDWMPNRHYDDGTNTTTNASVYNTDPRTRIDPNNAHFTLRKQQGFEKVQRLGSSPNEYVWKVTSSNGIINWYGGDLKGVADNAVLRNSDNYIVHWGLYRTEDVYGNNIVYGYDNRVVTGFSGANQNLNDGRIFCIESIFYTGFGNKLGDYSIKFLKDVNNIKPNQDIDGRLGLKRVSPYLLDKIQVYSEGTKFREYKFTYKMGRFGKTLLTKASEFDKNDKEFYHHEFEYYDDILSDGEDNYFSEGVDQIICNDADVLLKCFTSSDIPVNVITPNGTNVYVNGVLLQGGSFNSMNSFVAAMQAQHPVTSFSFYNNSVPSFNVRIDNTSVDYYEIKFTDQKGAYIVQLHNCNTLKKKNDTLLKYQNHFKKLNEKYEVDYAGGNSLKGDGCTVFDNPGFIIPGNIPSFNSTGAILGSTVSENYNAGGFLGFGVDFSWNPATKYTTIGGSYNYSWDNSESLTSLIDINGDGLDDMVFKKGGKLYWKRHYVNRSYNANNELQITHTFGAYLPITSINNEINDFYKSQGESSSWNLQVNFGFSGGGGFAGWDSSKNKSNTNIYFTDANGDGLMDIVKNGVVFFNRINTSGNPYFEPESELTENMLISANPVTVTPPPTETEVVMPNYDVVKVWEAPADGAIKIENFIENTDTTKEAIATIEMQKASKCYKVSFPVPGITTRVYNLQNDSFTPGITMSKIATSYNRSSEQINNLSVDLKYIVGGHNTGSYVSYSDHVFPLDDTHPLYMLNGNYNGRTYNAMSYGQLMNSGGFNYNVMSADFVSRFPLMMNEIVNIYPGTSFTQTHSYNAYQSIGQRCYSPVQDTAIFSGYITSSDSSFYPFYVQHNWISDTELPWTCNGYVMSSHSYAPTHTATTVPITTNIAVNGATIPNSPYTLFNNNDFVSFQNDIQNLYPGAVVSLNSYTNVITIVMESTSQVFNTIALTATNGTGSNTYNFTEITCNQSHSKEAGLLVELKDDWKSYQCSQEDLDFARNKVLAEAEDINVNKTIENEVLPTYITVKGETIEGKYGFIRKGEKIEWFKNKLGDIKDEKIITKLNSIISDYWASLKNNLSEDFMKLESERKKNEKMEAKKWLEEYYTREAEKRITDVSNKVNRVTCTYVPSEMCMLYGVKLNTSTPTVTNVITTSNSSCNASGGTLTVKKGDRIYFRIHAVDNGNPVVNWNPKVSYTNAVMSSMTDQNGLKPFSSSYSDGFILSQKAGTIFPGNGTVSISWDPINVNSPTDEVMYEIIKRVQNGSSPTDTVIFSKICPPNVATNVVPVGLNGISITGTTNTLNTQFLFRVYSTSNVNWKAIEWKPKMVCATSQPIIGNSGNEGNVATNETKYPIVDYSIYKSFLCGNKYNVLNISPYNAGGTFYITPDLSGVNFSTTDNGTLYLVAKRNNAFIGRIAVNVTNGTPAFTGNIAVTPNATNTMELGFYTDDSNRTYNNSTNVSLLSKIMSVVNVAKITQGSNTYYIKSSEVNLMHKLNQFGSMYRQWGQFLYNSAAATGAIAIPSLGVKLIKEELLKITDVQATALYNSLFDSNNQLNSDLLLLQNIDINSPNAFTTIQTALQNIQNNSGIGNMPFMEANPTREIEFGSFVEKWIGLHDENYSNANGFRAAKLSQNFSFQGNSNVAQGTFYTGAYGIDKFTIGEGQSVSAGGGLSGFNASGTSSLGGTSKVLTDYIDINGDRYPDILSTGEVQYTLRTGGLKQVVNRGVNGGDISIDYNSNWGITAAGSFAKSGKQTPGSEGAKPIANGKLKIGKPGISSYGASGSNSVGISGNFGQGESGTSRLWADFNGDGLPDIVTRNSFNNTVSVQLNLGTSVFTQNNNWGSFQLAGSKSTSFGGGLGFNYANASIEAGVSLGRTDSDTETTLMDINGDGTLDKLVSTNSQIKVDFNLGNKFDSGVTTATHDFSLFNSATTTTSGLNATASYSVIWPLYLIFTVIPLKLPTISVTASGGNSTNRTKKTIVDFDGDGFPDLIEEINSTKIRVYHSRIGRTNMLKTVHNPIGGSFVVDYEPKVKTYANPNAKWVMKSLVVQDGYDVVVSGNNISDGFDSYTKYFEYENGKYDRRERTFYGFNVVKEIDRKINSDGTVGSVYRTSVKKFHNESYYLNGFNFETSVYKGVHNPQAPEDNLYSKVANTFKIYELDKANGNNKILSNSNGFVELPLNFDVGGNQGRKQAIVLLSKTNNIVKEFTSNAIVSEIQMKYDEYGRIVRYDDFGDLQDAQDDYYSEITYHALNNNILNVVKGLKVYQNGSIIRERKTDVPDINTGAITQIEAWIGGTDFTKTAMKYDGYGNIVQIIYPENDNEEAMAYNYDYDATFNKYVEKITDAFGYTSQTLYDSRFDAPLSKTDIAGNKILYEYDSFGRVIKILASKEAGNTNPYTVAFEYMPTYNDIVTHGYKDCVPNNNFVPVAISKHYDSDHPDNPIETFTFIDGLARPIQIKKDIELNTGTINNPDYGEFMSVSGLVTYDEFGRAAKQFHPKKERKKCEVSFVINKENDSQAAFFTETQYDEIDRPVKTIDPEGSVSQFVYTLSNDGFGNLELMDKSIIDQSGSVQIITENYKNIRNRLTSVKKIGPSGDIWTRFNYNAIGELLSYTDAEDLTTAYQYDNLGRKIEVNHPDNGITKYAYDNANNLTKLETANLTAAGSSVAYTYEYNRLVNVKFPQTTNGDNISDITYKYGSTGNETGRLIYQNDASGEQEFEYGDMGELVYNRRVVVGPNIPARVFETSFVYDSWNRLKSIVYPDGEKVSYYYDLGGNLNRVKGVVLGKGYDYVQRIDYDHYEQQTYLLYGNNTETQYAYSPSLRRLSNLDAKTAAQQNMFNNSYTYDKVGNVKSITNNAAYNPVNQLGGMYFHAFKYDNLNRLASGSGNFVGFSTITMSNNSEYVLDMNYNDTHGIKSKTQVHVIQDNLANSDNTYNNNYEYISDSHKVKSIVDANTGTTEDFKYDLNGNMTLHSSSSGMNATMFWDESNRLRVMDKGNQMQHYIYDASGERILKGTSRVEQVFENGTLVDGSGVSFEAYTTYPSAYIVVNRRGEFSKHYYAGSQRIVSRMGETDAGIFENLGKTDFDPKKLQRSQKADLEQIVSKSDKGKVSFKEYKPETITGEDVDEELDNARNVQVTEQFPYKDIYFYHPDHLGSGTYLTDANGLPYQFFLNLPFGETMVEMHSFTENYASPYKFNGKELDAETGLYYYGARYYNPRISIWLSVDPLAEKYPNFNPYAYCYQNPILFTDPDGMAPETFGVDSKGNIKEIDKKKYKDENGKTVDRLYKLNSNGEKSNTYVNVENNILNNINEGRNGTRSYDYFFTKNDSQSQKLFEFLSENTSVEWAKVDENKNSWIVTSHSKDKEWGASDLLYNFLSQGAGNRNNYEHTHSHPTDGGLTGYSGPSGFDKRDKNYGRGDKLFSKGVNESYPKEYIKFRVYDVQSKQYILYDEKGSINKSKKK